MRFSLTLAPRARRKAFKRTEEQSLTKHLAVKSPHRGDHFRRLIYQKRLDQVEGLLWKLVSLQTAVVAESLFVIAPSHRNCFTTNRRVTWIAQRCSAAVFAPTTVHP